MPTSHTILTLKNAALDGIGELPLAPGDTNAYARWLNRNYEHAVRAALRSNPWNFAIELHQLNRSLTEPAFRWRYYHDLPPGWLRVLPFTRDGSGLGEPIKHAVIGNQIASSYDGDHFVTLVMDRQDPGTWDQLFADYVAAKLANGMAHRFTAKSSFVQLTENAMANAMATAAEINAFEGSPEPIEQYDIIRVRAGYDPSWR